MYYSAKHQRRNYTCTYCGAILDPGERCDCQKRANKNQGGILNEKSYASQEKRVSKENERH